MLEEFHNLQLISNYCRICFTLFQHLQSNWYLCEEVDGQFHLSKVSCAEGLEDLVVIHDDILFRASVLRILLHHRLLCPASIHCLSQYQLTTLDVKKIKSSSVTFLLLY